MKLPQASVVYNVIPFPEDLVKQVREKITFNMFHFFFSWSPTSPKLEEINMIYCFKTCIHNIADVKSLYLFS